VITPVIPLLQNPANRHREILVSHASQVARPAKRLYRLLTRDRVDWIEVQATIARLLVETKALSDVVDDAMEEVVE
jgi:hypothetical protein